MIIQMLFIWCGFVSIFDHQRDMQKISHRHSLQTRTKLTVSFLKMSFTTFSVPALSLHIAKVDGNATMAIVTTYLRQK